MGEEAQDNLELDPILRRAILIIESLRAKRLSLVGRSNWR